MPENAMEETKFFRVIELVSDDLRMVCRLLGKPTVCMAAPEVMDTVRMALQGLDSRLSDAVSEMRIKDV